MKKEVLIIAEIYYHPQAKLTGHNRKIKQVRECFLCYDLAYFHLPNNKISCEVEKIKLNTKRMHRYKVISGLKKLGTFGASYLYPIFLQLKIIRRS